MSNALVQRVDHLVYAAPALETALGVLEARLGVRATPGGQHLGRGTRNALIALGPRSYLEVIGPDPNQPAPSTRRWFGVDALTQPRLVAWAVASTQIDEIVARAARSGVVLGRILDGGRQRPDGTALRWRVTDPTIVLADGLIPFFMDWLSSPHPAADAARGCTLTDLRAEHPTPDEVRRVLALFDLDLDLREGAHPALVATLESPRGRVELR